MSVCLSVCLSVLFWLASSCLVPLALPCLALLLSFCNVLSCLVLLCLVLLELGLEAFSKHNMHAYTLKNKTRTLKQRQNMNRINMPCLAVSWRHVRRHESFFGGHHLVQNL